MISFHQRQSSGLKIQTSQLCHPIGYVCTCGRRILPSTLNQDQLHGGLQPIQSSSPPSPEGIWSITSRLKSKEADHSAKVVPEFLRGTFPNCRFAVGFELQES